MLPKAIGKAFGITADFALVDNAVDMVMLIFDRVFQSDDMIFTVFVDFIDNSRQCR